MALRKSIFFVLILLFVAVTGCSNSAKDAVNVPQETAQDTADPVQSTSKSEPEPDETPEQFKVASTEELQQLFEQTYAVENSRSKEPEQIAAEFSELQELALESSLSLPSNAETQYTEWRSMVITAIIEAENDLLKDNYNKLIADCIPYDEGVTGLWDSTPGLFYADRMDFDGDGIMELLLAYLEQQSGVDGGPNGSAKVTIDVYGGIDGGVVKYGELNEDWTFGDKWIKLFSNNGKLFIGYYSWGGGSGLPETYTFYSVENASLVTIENLSSERILSEEVNEDGTFHYDGYFTSFDDTISEEDFQARLSSYNEEGSIISFGEGTPANVSFDNGVLPERPALSLVLNGTAFELGDTPVINDGHILIPVPALERLGLAVYSIDKNNWIVSTKRDTLLILYWDFLEVRLNGEWQDFGDFMKIVDGELFVPIEPIAILFGGKVEQDKQSKIIAVDLSIPEGEQMDTAEVKAMYDFTDETAMAILEQAGYTVENALDWEVSYQYGEAVWSITWLPAGQNEMVQWAAVQRSGVIETGTYAFDPDGDW